MEVIAIFVGLGTIIILIFSILNCLCIGNKKDRETDAPDDNINNNKGLQAVSYHHINGDLHIGVPSDVIEAAKIKSSTVNRKLPEIPQDQQQPKPASNKGSIGELYATVEDTGLASPSCSANPNGELGASEVGSRASTVKENMLRKELHSYAKIHGQVSEERDTDTDTYDDPGIYASAQPMPSRSWDTSVYELPPPPVPEKQFPELGEPSGSHLSTTSAANAVSGRSVDDAIPFMTSPLMVSQELIYADELPDADIRVHEGNHSQKIRYTSISVREPLANIRVETARPPVERESHYTIVPDDADQMYAEIESAQNSASGSSAMYNQIESRVPVDNDSLANVASGSGDHPPAPPTVESLRSVAQAHSRHASLSGFIGGGDSSGTDTNCSGGGGGGASSSSRPTAQELMDLYSTVDKSKKKTTRNTVHVVDSSQSSGDSVVEEMYSKVQKKTKRLEPSTGSVASSSRGSACLDGEAGASAPLNFSPPLIGVETAVPPAKSGSLLLRRSSSKDDPGYERIQEVGGGSGSSTSALAPPPPPPAPSYHPRKKNFRSKATPLLSPIEHNYETLSARKKKCIGDYETIGDDYEDEIESGYEKVVGGGSRPTKDIRAEGVKKDEAGATGDDPTYEKVTTSGTNNFERADPNYESLRYASGNRSSASTLSSRAAEPRYWQIQTSVEEANDPLYEKIHNHEDDALDPNYEKVKTASELSFEASDPGYEKVQRQSRATFEEGEEDAGYERMREKGDEGADGSNNLTRQSSDPEYERINYNTVGPHRIQWDRGMAPERSAPRVNGQPSGPSEISTVEGSEPNGLPPTGDIRDQPPIIMANKNLQGYGEELDAEKHETHRTAPTQTEQTSGNACDARIDSLL